MINKSTKFTALVCALPMEAEPVLANLTINDRISHDGANIYECAHQLLPVVVMVCGVGSTSAKTCVSRLIAEFELLRIVNFGFAGAVDPTICTGQVVAPQKVGCFDMEETMDLKQAVFILPTDDNIYKSGKALQVDRPFGMKDKDLAAKQGAAMVDMESWTIARAAHDHGMDCYVIRAVTDEADFDFGELIIKKDNNQGPAPKYIWKDKSARREFLKYARLAADNNAKVIMRMLDHWAKTDLGLDMDKVG